jgi:4-aminobutyrate aminotransferase/(S)-3-amino-2-methylpropionate transaminase
MTVLRAGPETTAGILLEAVRGESGSIWPAQGFPPALSRWCTASGVVFIADEIQTGFCRTGDWFACENEDVVPDLITTAKGIAGGLPLAAVTGRAELMDAVHPGGLGGTYGGNPVACAAALGAIETMRELDLCARARHIGQIMQRRLGAMAERFPAIGEVRGRGAMVAIEVVQPGTTTPDAALAAAVNEACHSEGVLTLTCGTFGNVFRFLPPLVIDDALLEEGLAVVEQAFATATQ